MHRSPRRSRSWATTVFVGAASGVAGGFARLGWEVPFPPRTPEREATDPPQTLLEQVGFSPEFTHHAVTVAGHDVPVVSLGVHFAFSVGTAVTYDLVAQRWPKITFGRGTGYGIFVWGATHVVLMSLTHTVPAPWKRPISEHLSEFFGHALWMWTTDAVRRQLRP